MIRKIIGSLGSLLADAQEQGLAAHNAVRDLRRNRRLGKERNAEKRQKGKLKVGVDIPTPDEIKRFLTKARDLGLTGANAWSWDFASRPLYTDLWDAVASFHWPPTPPVPTAEAPEHLIELLNGHDPTAVAAFYCENAAHVTGLNTSVGTPAITDWYKTLFTAVLPNATFQLTGKNGEGNSMHFTWTATSDKGPVTNGNDTLGLYDGQILYHYTFFTVAQPEDTQTN
jgi:hypothetical protein